MKFKNISNKAIRDLSLIAVGELERDRIIKPGDTFEVKDPEMIKRVKATGLYREVVQAVPKKAKGGK
jgi:hypothetical protein